MRKLMLFGVLVFSASLCQAGIFEIEMTGPGGHSNGNYGNVNAVHAGARAVLALEKAIPCAVPFDFKGGATVNAIAADVKFFLNTDPCMQEAQEVESLITQAVKQGASEENTFRAVKPGDMVRGFPAEIRFSVKQIR